MEPMRPVVDRAVLHLIDTATFTGADFSIQHAGVCRMNPELARRVAQLALERCDASNRQGLYARLRSESRPMSFPRAVIALRKSGV